MPSESGFARPTDHPVDAPLVGVILGSKNDYAVMRAAVHVLREFGVLHEAGVVSAPGTPDWVFEYAERAAARGRRVLIAGVGGARQLRGRVAAMPVLEQHLEDEEQA